MTTETLCLHGMRQQALLLIMSIEKRQTVTRKSERRQILLIRMPAELILQKLKNTMLQPYLRTEKKESILKSSASNVRFDGLTTRMKESNITEIGRYGPMASITEDRYILWKR